MPLTSLGQAVTEFSNFNHRSVTNTDIRIHILHLDETVAHEIAAGTQPKEYVEWIFSFVVV